MAKKYMSMFVLESKHCWKLLVNFIV